MSSKKQREKQSAKSKKAAIERIYHQRISPDATEEERLIAYAMAQTEVNEPHLWRKIIALD